MMIKLLLVLLLIALPVMAEELIWEVEEFNCEYIREELSNKEGEVLAIWEYSENPFCGKTLIFKGRLGDAFLEYQIENGLVDET